MTQAQVRAQFGTPVDTRGPVGQPPISRWVYPDYTVYFENQVVLHNVTRPLNETADNARPANDAGDTEDRHPGDGAGNAEPSPPPPLPHPSGTAPPHRRHRATIPPARRRTAVTTANSASIRSPGALS